MISFASKRLLITGASGAIGGALARAFHGLGATVALSGTRVDALTDLAQELGNDRVFPFPCDLSDAPQVDNLIPQVERDMGPLDIVINNAGITRDALLLRLKDDDWQTVLDVNLSANFRLCRAAIKSMIKRRYGRILNITSVVGITGNAGQANYCAAKAGLIGFSKALALEVASRGITVNCIAPGFIHSPMTSALPEKERLGIINKIPQGVIGTPEDVAFCALYLAHERAAYVTGQTLHVNGGMVMV